MRSRIGNPRISRCLSLFFAAVIGLIISIGSSSQISADATRLLADRHKAAGVECGSCHRETPPKLAVPTAVCTGCHGDYDAIIKRTEKIEPNPHDSHEGRIDCVACHHSHKASENYCARCHAFGFKVP